MYYYLQNNISLDLLVLVSDEDERDQFKGMWFHEVVAQYKKKVNSELNVPPHTPKRPLSIFSRDAKQLLTMSYVAGILFIKTETSASLFSVVPFTNINKTLSTSVIYLVGIYFVLL